MGRSDWIRRRKYQAPWCSERLNLTGTNYKLLDVLSNGNIEAADANKYQAQWATVYLEYEIPILAKIDDLWSYKTIFKH